MTSGAVPVDGTRGGDPSDWVDKLERAEFFLECFCRLLRCGVPPHYLLTFTLREILERNYDEIEEEHAATPLEKLTSVVRDMLVWERGYPSEWADDCFGQVSNEMQGPVRNVAKGAALRSIDPDILAKMLGEVTLADLGYGPDTGMRWRYRTMEKWKTICVDLVVDHD